MNVKNRRTVRRLSLRSLRTSGKRNIIAAVAIALTTVLFTTLFTIVMSINSSYEAYTFRQIGGYAHATFKSVDEEQIKKISEHPDIKQAGKRITAGTVTEGVFGKIPAEISYMDDNYTEWSYIDMEKGHAPENFNEIAMDNKSLELLGIKPVIGTEIRLTYDISDNDSSRGKRTDTFILSGWWEYDDICPVHFINVSESYVQELQKKLGFDGDNFLRTDLEVMLGSSINIEEKIDKVAEELGYQTSEPSKENYIKTGVNWGYTAAKTDSVADGESIAAMAAFLILVIFTGYLIIYNIFQISVTGDIRYYGLLKTIGVTPRQLRRIIRQQAGMLWIIGSPVGLILGYGTGYVLTPVILSKTIMGDVDIEASASPVIFAAAALFSFITVMLSCMKPGRIASRVSPVEAVRYTEGNNKYGRKKGSFGKVSTRGARIWRMAFSNLGRNKLKTALVVVSLSLAVVLFSLFYTFVGGFSMDKYLQRNTCADFIVAKTDYFRFDANNAGAGISDEAMKAIQAVTDEEVSGRCWGSGKRILEWLPEQKIKERISNIEMDMEGAVSSLEKRGELYGTNTQVEGVDKSLFHKLKVIDGDLKPLSESDENAIAIHVPFDNYGNPSDLSQVPKVGDKITLTYVEEAYVTDSRTGKKSYESIPEEYMQYHVKKGHDVEYTVCALVNIPQPMSYRYEPMIGNVGVLETEKMVKDSGGEIFPLFYMFDTPDKASEAEAEKFLADMTKDDMSDLMYESKAKVRDEFEGFKNMFMLLGGVLCGIIGLVGILNFFNGIMTGILSRRREFAMLQSIGMTGKQLKKMLIMEGLFYAAATILLSVIITLLIGPPVGNIMEDMFWFYKYSLNITAICMVAPVFIIMGVVLPVVIYRSVSKKTIVDRLRENE